MSPEGAAGAGNFGREYVIAHNSSDLTARSVAGYMRRFYITDKKTAKLAGRSGWR